MIKPTAVLAPTSPRAEAWRATFGDLTAPLLSPVPVVASSPVGDRLFYRVDVAQLTEEQIEATVAHMAKAFDLSEEEVRRALHDPGQGLPILADDDVHVVFDQRFVS